ncbi:glucosaminidase domain-containing protein [Streptococcus pluranimalium]|uniref:glucosaminidase domain-containing protein n=1 Tax=Streptococcus pluranimalium TaxID=82348 RepID=UPI0024155BF2|nr:glucosaminidase domain-containing protein [Streptococcus pluranimalium]MDY3042510.1 glucosaminidase domain-containing protein [Streptococcus pluranimalium]WFM79694.1 glucosaminidase domain-containing protein [Streptococcus pluranimalium]
MRRRFKFSFFISLAIAFILIGILPLALNYGSLSAEKKVATGLDNDRFIEKIAPDVQELSTYYGIRPSVLIAQAAYDSNFGQNLLAVKYNNLFAIPAKPGEDSIRLSNMERNEGNISEVERDYAIYPSWNHALEIYLAGLKDGSLANKNLYKILATASSISVAAQAFYRYDYTQDDDYANQLERIIKEYDLEKYDKQID